MLCAISGEAPEVPVASRKSGTVFEKRLIEAYIQENGKDPVTGEELSLDDLIQLKTERVVKPRPPVLTSIPSLLSAFQNEWDALALESYTLKQHLSQLRQELSTALYNNDAAVRVIARLTKERDEARDALSRVSLQDRQHTSATNGESMQVDTPSLPPEVQLKITSTQESLSKTRRKRPVPQGWAEPDNIQSLEAAAASEALSTNGTCLAVSQDGSTALAGAVDGTSCTYALADGKVIEAMEGDGSAITDVVFWENKAKLISVIANSNGEVAVVDGSQKVSSYSAHAGPATALAMHPSGSLVASVGVDKSYVLYDLDTGREAARVFTDAGLISCQFHPDGHLLAAGTNTNQIKVFDVKSGSIAAEFTASGPVPSLSFSENGIWLAVAVRGSPNVGIWDLRKGAELKTLDFGTAIDSISFDYSGQYLAAAGQAGVAVQWYDKSAKAWTGILSKALPAIAVAWGAQAKSLVALVPDGSMVSLL